MPTLFHRIHAANVLLQRAEAQGVPPDQLHHVAAMIETQGANATSGDFTSFLQTLKKYGSAILTILPGLLAILGSAHAPVDPGPTTPITPPNPPAAAQ